MALVPIRIDRTSKPPLGTPLRSDGHCNVQGLVALPLNEMAGGVVFSSDNNPLSNNADWNGSSLSFVAGNADFIDLGSRFATTTGVTVLIGITTSSVNTLAFSSRAGGTIDGYEILLGPGGVSGTFSARTGVATAPTSNVFTVGVPQVLGLRYDKTKLTNIINGKIGNSVAYSANISPTQNLCIAKRATLYSTQIVDWMLVYPYTPLTDDQIASLSANPWQVYEPEIVWVEVGGTPATITGTFSAIEAPDGWSSISSLINSGSLSAVGSVDALTSAGALSVVGSMPAIGTTDLFNADGSLTVLGTMAATGNPDFARFEELVATTVKKGGNWQAKRNRDDEQVLMAFLHSYMNTQSRMYHA